MISLQLRDTRFPSQSPAVTNEQPEISLTHIEEQLAAALTQLATVIDAHRRTTIIVPADILFHAMATLFPAERMSVVAARQVIGRTTLGVSYDVTGVGPDTHRAHVRANPAKLASALLGFERAGSYLGAWLHSHPGSGPYSTTPSSIDRSQFADWAKDFGSSLIAMIFVADGFVRLWGDAIESGMARVEMAGQGIRPLGGHHHVYRIG